MHEKKEINFDSMNKEPIKPKMACEIFDEMLSNKPQLRKEHIGGVPNIGVSFSGNLLIITNNGGDITSYDQDTNSLLRAKFACDEGMLVSPLSTSRHTLFVRPDRYETHAKKAEQLDLQSQSSERCVIQ